MSKRAILTLTAAALMIVVVLYNLPGRANQFTKYPVSGNVLPDSIQKIIGHACTDCHTTGGNGMACAHVNFSKWSDYSVEKQASKANLICKNLSKSSMPPKGWRREHPDEIPTQMEVNIICAWSEFLNK